MTVSRRRGRDDRVPAVFRPACNSLSTSYCAFGQAENSKADAGISFGRAVRLDCHRASRAAELSPTRRWSLRKRVTGPRGLATAVRAIRCPSRRSLSGPEYPHSRRRLLVASWQLLIAHGQLEPDAALPRLGGRPGRL